MKIKIAEFEKEIKFSELREDYFDVDFDGRQKIRFGTKNDTVQILDAMNGYGDNNFNEMINEMITIVFAPV